MKKISEVPAFAPGMRRPIRLADIPALFSEGPEAEPSWRVRERWALFAVVKAFLASH